MAENVLGRIILEAGNKAMGTTGGGAPPINGLLEGGAPPGGGGADSSKEASGRRFQKGIEAFNKKSLEFAKAQPRWFTSIFKKMGIQMGLAGILKQSQIFTSTVGALFQIFGAFVDVLLAPLIRPLFLPILRWLARRIPDVSRASKAFFNVIGKGLSWMGRVFKNMISGAWWTETVFGGLISFFTETLPGILTTAFTNAFDFAKNLGTWIKDGVISALRWMYDNTFARIHFKIGKEGDFLHWEYRFPQWGGDGSNLGSSPQGETQFHEEKVTGAGKFMDSVNDTVLHTLDKNGKLLSAEDLTTIEGAYQANKKVDDWLALQGAETTTKLVERMNVTHEGPNGDNGDNGKSWYNPTKYLEKDFWFEKIFNPKDWLSVFGVFEKEFANFWSGGAMSDVVKATGVAVGASLTYKAGKKMVQGLGEAFKAVSWPAAKLIKLLNAAADSPSMMGLNTAKWVVRQFNIFDDTNVIRTLAKKGLKGGAIELAGRAVKTMGSGIGNAAMSAWTDLTSPVRTAARKALAVKNAAAKAIELAKNFLKIGIDVPGGGGGGDLPPPRKNPPIKVVERITPNAPPSGPDAANQGKINKALKKFGELKTKFTSMIKGKAGWTISKISSSFRTLASLSSEVIELSTKAGLPRIATYARFIKGLGARLLPFAATAVALGQTGFNIKQIWSRNDLSWFSPDEKLLEDRMQPILDMITKVDKKDVSPFAWAAAGEGLNAQALRTVMGSTKAGNIGTQAVLGGLEAILGLGGGATMPLQAALMLASMGHMQSISPDSSAYAQTVDLESFLADAQIGLTSLELTNAVAAGVAEGVRMSTMHGTMDIVGNASMDWL